MCAHPSTPIPKSHVTDCYVAVVVTTTNTYKYLPANQGIMFKEKNKTPDDNSKCWNERDSSHVVTTVTDILLSI